jgi:hypothetical protein
MPRIEFRAIFAPRHRAILLDIVAFVFNLILMSALTNLLANLAAQTGSGAVAAEAIMALFCLGLVFLQPIGAILKRQRAHQRNPDLDATIFMGAGRMILIAYFILQLMFSIYAVVLLIDALDQAAQVSTGALAALFVGIPLVAVANTFVVYFYFSPPKAPARLSALASSQAEILGDACLFLGTLCFQALWWYLLADPYFSSRPNDLGELAGKILAFAIMALMLYLPPRIFYWAEDINRKATWLSMAVANLPVILRILFGAG